MLEGNVSVVLAALVVAIGPVSSIALAEMRDSSIHRSLCKKRFQDFELQMTLGIETDERIFGLRIGEKSREKPLHASPMRPLAPSFLASEQADLAPDFRW